MSELPTPTNSSKDVRASRRRLQEMVDIVEPRANVLWKECEVRMNNLSTLSDKTTSSIKIFEDSSTNWRTKLHATEVYSSLRDRAERLLELSQVSDRQSKNQTDSIRVRMTQYQYCLDKIREQSLNGNILSEIEFTTDVMAIITLTHTLDFALRQVAVAGVVEEIQYSMQSFLNIPPVERRAKRAIKMISGALARDLSGLAFLGTAESIVKVFMADERQDALIRVATTEYERLFDLQDNLKAVLAEQAKLALLLSTSAAGLVEADELAKKTISLISSAINK